MNTKVLKLKYLAAAFMAMAASSAFAAPAPLGCDTTNGATTVNTCVADYKMYIAGSSALGNAVKAVVPVDLFDATAPITIVHDASADGNNAAISAWFGTGAAGTEAAGKKLFVVYNNQNGSAAGISQLLSTIKDTTIPEQQVVTVGPLDSKSAIALTQTKALTANSCTLGTDGPLFTGSTITAHNVTCTTFGRMQADVGLSDVRPDLLFALEGAKPKALSTLSYFPIADQGFGVAVNANLYNAMQTQQIADGRIPSTCTAGDLTGACQPSISRADYASLVTVEGGIKSAAALLNNPADTTMLTLARRDDLSGTQASTNMYFDDNACGVAKDSKGKAIKGVLGGALTVLGSPVTAGITTTTNMLTTSTLKVDANPTGGQVKTELNSTTGYAIGTIGLGETEPARTATSWKYVKIDGQSPNFLADGITPAHANRTFLNGTYGFVVTSFAATDIKPLDKTSVVATAPNLVNALIGGLKASTLHDLPGIGYLDGAADPSSLDGFTKQAHYIHKDGNSCSPLIKM